MVESLSLASSRDLEMCGPTGRFARCKPQEDVEIIRLNVCIHSNGNSTKGLADEVLSEPHTFEDEK
jgi:hypothetical protein